MPSLRERKARPSYSNIAEGLQTLEDSDEEARPASPIGSGSVNGRGSPSSANGIRPSKAKDSDDESMSSGSSSEFRPDEQGGEKGGAQEVDEEDDDDELISDGGASDDDPMGEPEGEDDDGEDTVSVSATGTGAGTATIRPFLPKPVSSRKGIAPVFHQTSTTLLPMAYREIVQSSAQALTKAVTVPKNDFEKAQADTLDKNRQLGYEAFPSGPVTPFATRLTEEPVLGELPKFKWVREVGDVERRREARQKRGWTISRHTPTAAAWQSWEGEGWWPEMYEEGFDGGPGRIKGWRLREEVKLGFESVGRMRLDGIECLSRREAQAYLPKPTSGKSSVTCHLVTKGKDTIIDFSIFEQQRLDQYNDGKKGFIFSAGGPIWGMDWCPHPTRVAAKFDHAQYLAVSTTDNIDTPSVLGAHGPSDARASIQIWSLRQPPASVSREDGGNELESLGLRCEMVLCIEGGAAMELKWLPMGAWDEVDRNGSDILPKLGILAAVQMDGSVHFYSVPQPSLLRQHTSAKDTPRDDPLFIRNHDPILTIKVADSTITCMDWMTGTQLATGLSNGHAAVWDIADALRSGVKDLALPTVYMSVALSAVRTVCVGRFPPADSQGNPVYDEDPFLLFFGCSDGTACAIDIRDPQTPYTFQHTRNPIVASAWANNLASPIFGDQDYTLTLAKISGWLSGRSHTIGNHRGPLWDAATSDYHTMAASAGSDGAVLITNYHKGYRRKKNLPLIWDRLYEVDYDQHTGHYRIIDSFYPETMVPELATGRGVVKKGKLPRMDNNMIKVGTWSPHVGVHRVAWQSGAGIGRAGWLASGGASGLARVEWVAGRFTKDSVPPGLDLASSGGVAAKG